MFERWTDRARKVMALANQEAQRFNHEYIDTEHILLGLIREGSGTGIHVLKNMGIDWKPLRLAIEKLMKSGPDVVTMGKLPLRPSAKKALEHAQNEARALNHNYVGTEHLLLALIRETEGNACQALMACGVEHEAVQKELLNLLGGGIAKDSKSYEETEPLTFLIDPGQATAEDIGELFFRLSRLYKMMGGSGLEFRTLDVREGVMSNV